MAGYWRNETETNASLRDGWLFTGDLGWLDDDDYLYFVDRKKDVIRRRGENISSQEVEDVIKRHENVLDCAIIAVPSDLGEDEVKAYITPATRRDRSNPKKSSTGAPTIWRISKSRVILKSATNSRALPACASARTCCGRSGKT